MHSSTRIILDEPLQQVWPLRKVWGSEAEGLRGQGGYKIVGSKLHKAPETCVVSAKLFYVCMCTEWYHAYNALNSLHYTYIALKGASTTSIGRRQGIAQTNMCVSSLTAWTRPRPTFPSSRRQPSQCRTCGVCAPTWLVSGGLCLWVPTESLLTRIQNSAHASSCLLGALVHTRAEGGKRAYLFVDLHQWPSTSNMTIAILLHVIAQQERLSQVREGRIFG